MKPRHGRNTVEAYARRMLESGLGLTEREIERFRARVDAVRNRQRPEYPDRAGEFRSLLERRYQELHK